MRRKEVEEPRPRCHWRELQLDISVYYPTEAPAEPKVGQGGYDPMHRCLCIWDGMEWMPVPLD